MGILLGALAGAGDYLARATQDEIKNIDQQELLDKQQELAIAKEKALQDYKRQMDAADAQRVSDIADASRVSRAKGIIEADTGLKYTPDEVKSIISDPTWTQNYGARYDTGAPGVASTPTSWDDQGNVINPTTHVEPARDRTALEAMRDTADAARSIGRLDMSKDAETGLIAERQVQAGERSAMAQAAETARKEIRDRADYELGMRREDSRDKAAEAATARVEAMNYKTDKIVEAAQIRADGAASKKDKSEATLNLNTTVKVQSDLIAKELENQDIINRALKADPADKVALDKLSESNAMINDAKRIRTLAQTALGQTLTDGAYKGGSPTTVPAPKAAAGPVKAVSEADYDALPSGTVFQAPDGSIRRKP